MKQSDRWLIRAAQPIAPFLLIALLSLIDIFRAVYLSSFTGEPGPLRHVWLYELTSGAMLLALMPFGAWMSTRFPLHRHSFETAAAHVFASLLFSAMHVAGMIVLRQLTFALLGSRYDFGALLPGFAYEYGKDLFTYGSFIAIFTFHHWATGVIERRREIERARSAGGFPVATSKGIVLIPFPAMLRIEASGNYVTLITAHGEFLHRATMKEMEELLPPAEFARTHRSHIVSLAAICGVRTDPNGDKSVEFNDGTRIPLSRTYAKSREWIILPANQG